MTILARKFFQKFHTKTHVLFDAFSMRNGFLFSLKNKALRSESVNNLENGYIDNISQSLNNDIITFLLTILQEK